MPIDQPFYTDIAETNEFQALLGEKVYGRALRAAERVTRGGVVTIASRHLLARGANALVKIDASLCSTDGTPTLGIRLQHAELKTAVARYSRRNPLCLFHEMNGKFSLADRSQTAVLCGERRGTVPSVLARAVSGNALWRAVSSCRTEFLDLAFYGLWNGQGAIVISETAVLRGFRTGVAIAGGSYSQVRHLLPASAAQRRSETQRVAAPPSIVRAVPIVDTAPEELDPFGYPLDLAPLQDVEYSDELKAEMDEYEKRERAEGWAIEREAALGILDGSIPSDLDQDGRAFLAGELEYHARKHRDKFSEGGCGAPSCDLCAELPP